MRLLWVKAGRLLPVDSGGKLRSYHLARALARRHELTMLTYYEGPRDVSYEQKMESEFPGAVTIRYGPHRIGGITTAMRYALRILSPAPFAVSKFTDRRVRAMIAATAERRNFDALICDFLSASLNFSAPESIPSILFQHNVESSLWERQARHAAGLLERVVYGIEAAKMRRYEPRAVRRFRQVVAVSEADRTLMSTMTDPSRITVVPTGVDASRFGAEAEREPARPIVLFLGTMDWEANIDGVEWMCNTMWAQIRQRVPDAVFHIVGRQPHDRIRRLASQDIEVTGSVPSVDPYLTEAAVFVVPLRIGGGTRLKIFEAMSAGRAIVSTTVGAEGLPVTDGVNILLADEPAAFTEAVVRVLNDASLRRTLGRAASALAREHDWSAVVGAFEGVIERATGVVPPPAR